MDEKNRHKSVISAGETESFYKFYKATTECLYLLFEELATQPPSAAHWEDCLWAVAPPPSEFVVFSPSPVAAPPAPTTPTPSCPATPPAPTRIPAATPSAREGSVNKSSEY